MNRFLAGLVERAEGRAPVLQRRARSLFEPESLPNAAIVEPLEREELRVSPAPHAPVEEAPRSPRPANDPRKPRDDGREIVRRRLHESRTAPAPAREAPPPTPPHEESRRAPPPANAVRAEQSDDRPRRPSARPAPLPTPPPVTVPTAAVLPVRLAPQRTVTTLGSVEPAARARRNEDTPPPTQPTPVVRRASAQPAVPALARRAPPVVQHPAVLLAKAQTAVARRDHAVPPAPAPVQITIGRVEVRAAPAGSERAPQRAGPATPRLSLNDYLRERNGGSR